MVGKGTIVLGLTLSVFAGVIILNKANENNSNPIIKSLNSPPSTSGGGAE